MSHGLQTMGSMAPPSQAGRCFTKARPHLHFRAGTDRCWCGHIHWGQPGLQKASPAELWVESRPHQLWHSQFLVGQFWSVVAVFAKLWDTSRTKAGPKQQTKAFVYGLMPCKSKASQQQLTCHEEFTLDCSCPKAGSALISVHAEVAGPPISQRQRLFGSLQCHACWHNRLKARPTELGATARPWTDETAVRPRHADAVHLDHQYLRGKLLERDQALLSNTFTQFPAS